MKKILLSLVVFTLCLLIFVSCGSETTEQTTPNSTLPDSTPQSTVVTTVKPKETTNPITVIITQPKQTTKTTETTKLPITSSTATTSSVAVTSSVAITSSAPTVPTQQNPTCLNDLNKMTVKAIAFEKNSNFGENIILTYVFNDNATEIDQEMLNGMKNNTIYAAVRINNEPFRIDHYEASGVYLYCNVEGAGALLVAGVSYSVSLEFYNSNDSLLYYSKNELLASTMSTLKTPERESLTITLPTTGLNKVQVAQNTISSNAIEMASGSTLGYLFDGTTANKFTGTVQDGIPTVYFSLKKAEILTHYTLRTANNAASYPERNPNGWRLYGKVGEMWMLLSKVENDAFYETGLTETNAAAFSYAVTTHCACQEYKIEFIFASSIMQLAEIELYATEGFSVENPNPSAGTPLNEMPGVQATLLNFCLIPELQNRVGVSYYLSSDSTLVRDIQNALASGEMFAAITLDKTVYQIRDYVINGNNILFDLQSAGAPVFSGVIYQVSLGIYSSAGTRLYYTSAEASTSAYQTPNLPPRQGMDITLPTGLSQVKVNTNSVKTEGIEHWGDGAPTNFFDGDTDKTKIGGGVADGEFTLTFSLSKSTTLTYYTLYTGNDTVTHPDRNPIGWVLYGKVGNEYVVLADARENAVAYHGMDTVNATPYSYKIDNPTACKDYMIVFYTNGMFQLNEMVLYTG